MQTEHKILAAVIEERSAWTRIKEFIEEKDFTAQGWLILKYVKEYYKQDPKAQYIDQDILLDRIGRNLHNAKALEGFREVIDSLPYGAGAATIAQEVLEHKREAASVRLEAALASRSGRTMEEIKETLEEYQAIHAATDLESFAGFEEYAPDLEEMFAEALSDSKRIQIWPKALNDMIGGGAFPGHCVVVFGRVEMGKSLCAINMTTGFIKQGYTTLYIENEDTLLDTNRRFVQRLLRKSREWCLSNPHLVKEKAQSLGYERFKLTDIPENVRDVERAIQFYRPSVVVINQMRNMVQGDNQVSKLDTLAHQLRRIGKKYNVLMVLITAAREGEVDRNGYIKPKPILEIGDVYSSRTGIPAAADLLIGWGGSDKMMRAGQASISICKNKLVDGGGHGHVYVNVDPKTGVVTGE